MDVTVDLTDAHGAPLAGAVSAVVIDAYGGGGLRLEALDEQTLLCDALGVNDDRCPAALEPGVALDPIRRAMLGTTQAAPIAPSNDPGGQSEEELSKAFSDVVKSLEGALPGNVASRHAPRRTAQRERPLDSTRSF